MKKALFTLLCSSSLISGCYEPMSSGPAASHEGVKIPSVNEMAKQKERQFAQQLTALQARNPEAEAQASINQGEKYFLCGAGRSRTVPGVAPEVFAQRQNNCPVRCLDGVSDALYGENHRRYLTAALEYSERWNRVMLEACR